jgi:nucleoside diphosphate kinase
MRNQCLVLMKPRKSDSDYSDMPRYKEVETLRKRLAQATTDYEFKAFLIFNMTGKILQDFYPHQKDADFFPAMRSLYLKHPWLAFIVEGEEIFAILELIKPEIRAELQGTESFDNGIHISESPEEMAREMDVIGLVMPKMSVVAQ